MKKKLYQVCWTRGTQAFVLKVMALNAREAIALVEAKDAQRIWVIDLSGDDDEL